MTEREFDASADALYDVLGFVEEELDAAGCSMKASMQITVCVEEIFVNIANYAYGDKSGKAFVSVGYEDGYFVISFRDTGVPFDPLKLKEPDISLSAEDRKIGGLGIFMVKKSMDDVRYSYEDGQNILTIAKKL